MINMNDPGHALTAIGALPPPAPAVQFFTGVGNERREVGRLIVTADGLVFEGEADAAAHAFFGVLKQICDLYLKQQAQGQGEKSD